MSEIKFCYNCKHCADVKDEDSKCHHPTAVSMIHIVSGREIYDISCYTMRKNKCGKDAVYFEDRSPHITKLKSMAEKLFGNYWS